MPVSCGEKKPHSLSSGEVQELGKKPPRPPSRTKRGAGCLRSPLRACEFPNTPFKYLLLLLEFSPSRPPARPRFQNWKRVHSFPEAKTS